MIAGARLGFMTTWKVEVKYGGRISQFVEVTERPEEVAVNNEGETN